MLLPLSRLCMFYLNFEWFENDPRLTEPDIGSMPLFKDSRRCHHRSRAIEETLGVIHAAPFRIFACVFSELAPARLTGRITQLEGERLRVHQLVESNRQTEKEEWERAINYWVDLICANPSPNSTFDESWFREKSVMTNRDNMTAIGMCLFPEEAFGRVDDHNFAELYHSWRIRAKSSITPGLALFDLSSLPP
ncbi:hypothetical protein ACHAP3_004265 [Botrytis cinerea]